MHEQSASPVGDERVRYYHVRFLPVVVVVVVVVVSDAILGEVVYRTAI